MKLTNAQRELLEDKFVLWDRASREGNMELRDYNRRAAEALKVALSICSAAPEPGYEAEPVAIKTVGWAALASNGNIRFWLRDREPVQEFANLYGCDVVRLVASPVPVAIERLAEELVAAEEQGRPFLLLKTDEVRAILQRLSNQQGGEGKGALPELPCGVRPSDDTDPQAQHFDGGQG